MLTHVPPIISDDPALVVVLHGCGQTAADYDIGAGWSTLADRFGFVVLLPEQQRSNNANGCFSWYQAGDIKRGKGEAYSIRQMVQRVTADYQINPARIFVTGLSAGGAMTSVMLETYPDVFAGGAIVAGPYGAAKTVYQAFASMYQCPRRPSRTWGDMVRVASPHVGSWPRISIWHGGADTTVSPSNAQGVVKQWTDVHHFSPKPSRELTVDGYSRQVWLDPDGKEVIEFYNIAGMRHGAPLATGPAEGQCGAAGPFLLEVGISSSYHIAKFFGLTQPSTPSEGSIQRRRLDVSALLQHSAGGHLKSENPTLSQARPSVSYVGTIITNALQAVGIVSN